MPGGDQIDFIQEDRISRLDLHPQGVSPLWKSDQGVRIGHRDHAIQAHLGQAFLDVEDQGIRLGHPGGFYHDHLRVYRVDHFIDRRFKLPEQGAADTSPIQLGDADIFPLDDLAVDGDFAKLIHENGDLLRHRGQNVVQQRGFSASQSARDQSDGSSDSHLSALDISDGHETHHAFADPRFLGGLDDLIDIFVCPSGLFR